MLARTSVGTFIYDEDTSDDASCVIPIDSHDVWDDPSGSGRVEMLTSPAAAARGAVATGAWVKSKHMYITSVYSNSVVKHTHGYKLDNERQQQPYQEQSRRDRV